MGEQETLFDVGEMRILRIGCGKCGTKILFDCGNEAITIPDHCPSCGQLFHEKAGWILGYRKWYLAASQSKDVVFQFQAQSPNAKISN